jgi:hypothetical protein
MEAFFLYRLISDSDIYQYQVDDLFDIMYQLLRCQTTAKPGCKEQKNKAKCGRIACRSEAFVRCSPHHVVPFNPLPGASILTPRKAASLSDPHLKYAMRDNGIILNLAMIGPPLGLATRYSFINPKISSISTTGIYAKIRCIVCGSRHRALRLLPT